MNYRFAYSVGFHPWEDAASDPPFVDKFHELIDREESGRSPPFGAAVDLGTGSGIWGIELAKRGWQVTGIEIIEKALARARERVQRAGVNMQLVKGDVTALRNVGIGTGLFRLLTCDFTIYIPSGKADGMRIDAMPQLTPQCDAGVAQAH
jgi:SAM-dependent methyltransferase